MSLIQRIQECHHYDLKEFYPFVVCGQQVGWVHHHFANLLKLHPNVFCLDQGQLSMHPSLTTPKLRTSAAHTVFKKLFNQGALEGWRNEDYAVATGWGQPVLLNVERAAVVKLGIKGYGLHVNGYQGHGANLKLWVAKRSQNRPVAPGKLDHLVAGGLPIGLSLHENLIKEAHEEAGISKAIAIQAKPVGALSYMMQLQQGMRCDTIFCYDLELPGTFTPINQDGEVDCFDLWPIEQVRHHLETTQDFKFNTALVIGDFMIRHGVIKPDEPGYLDLIPPLHPSIPSFSK